jgi:hypothetical protein
VYERIFMARGRCYECKGVFPLVNTNGRYGVIEKHPAADAPTSAEEYCRGSLIAPTEVLLEEDD